MKPTVSIVVATFNYARYLPLAIESALAQTFEDFELLVVDDGSTDETPQIVRPYLDDSRIRYDRTSHLGQPAAKNAGIRCTTAPLVAFLDADDLWMPDKLHRQLELFQSRPTVGVVYCRRMYIDAAGQLLDLPERPLHRGRILPAIFRQNFICFSSTVVRRELFEQVGYFDESLALAIDYDLWLRAATRFEFDFVDDPLVLYRTGHANLSTRTVERLQTARRIIDRFLNESRGREMLSARLIRQTLADLHCDRAWVVRSMPLRSLAAYARALCEYPLHFTAWRGMATCWWPSWLRETARRILRLLRKPRPTPTA